MPTYSYTCESCHKTRDVFFGSFNDKTDVVECECGNAAHYDFAATFGKSEFVQAGDREYVSEALAVRPDEVAKTIEEDKRMGSMAEKYLPDGRLVFKSWEQKRKYERARGYNE